MSELERLFDAIDKLTERINKHYEETLKKLTEIETEQRYLKEAIANIEPLRESINGIQMERAQEKGKWIGACAVGTILGGTIFYILEKVGAVAAVLGGK